MSDRDRSDRSALIVLGLLVGSIVLVSILGLWARHEVEHHKGCPAYAEATQHDEKELSAPCFDDHIFFGDGYAQWAMTILAAVATGASIWALVYLRRTLAETSRIGQAQVRAYPAVVSVVIDSITNGIPGWEVTIRNSGNSPALTMTSFGRIMLSYQEDILPAGTIAQRGMEVHAAHDSQVVIQANSEGKIKVIAQHPDDAIGIATMKKMASNVPRKRPRWSVNFFFKWVDVFGVKYVFYINADSIRVYAAPDIVGALDEVVLRTPFEITFQSESRPQND